MQLTRVAESYGQAKTEAYAYLREHSAKGEVLVVAPTRAAADDLVRELGMSTGIHRFAAKDLAGALAKRPMAERNLAPVSGVSVEALLTGIIHRARPRLEYFGPVCGTPGFPKALARTLSDLRLAMIDAALLGAGAGPMSDLGILLRAYEAELADCGLIDFAGMVRLSTRAGVKDNRLAALPSLWWFVEDRSPAEAQFREAVTGNSPSCLTFTLGARGEVSTALDSVRRYLFGREQAPRRQPDDSFTLFSASGEALECVEIARQIRFAGIPFDAIAVLLRDPERYEALMAEALRRAGIPAWFARGSARPDVSGRAMLALLNCAAEGISVSRFVEYIALDQAPGNAQPAIWERLLERALIHAGQDRWRRRLELLRDSFDIGSEQAEDVHELMEFALPIVERLGRLPLRAVWGDWLAHLEELAEHALRSPEAVLELLGELRPMEQVGPVTLHDVVQVLTEHLTVLRRRPDNNRYGHVWVGPIDLAAGMSFRLVFVPGLAEGGFPRRIAHDPLLLDEYRRSISPDLATRQERTETERRLLRNAVACAGERMVASYPRMDLEESRRRVPSLYAFDLLRAAEGWLPGELREFEDKTKLDDASLGWPAPESPENAIDASEFDLSMLRRARGPGNHSGAMAYLRVVHPHLADALRTRGRRWRRKWFSSDGMVADQEISTLMDLDEFTLKRTAYAPSALQHFADCPYRFYLRSIVRVRPAVRKSSLERMEPAVRGELFHAAQTQLLRRLRDRKLLPIRREAMAAATALIRSTLRDLAKEFEEIFAPTLTGIWEANLADVLADLEGWLLDVAENDPEWVPLHEELAFGLPMTKPLSDPASRREPVAVPDGYRIAGSIDLVEQHSRTGMLRITDHKTGRIPDDRPVQLGGGRVLQPLLYAMAAEEMLGKPALAGQLYYATRRENYERIQMILDDRARENAREALRIIHESIREGFLPAAPAEGACRDCDYQAMCGPYEDERLQLKPQDQLRSLEQLRKMP